MARPSKGARLQLFGPDAQYGARAKRGFTRYVWFILDGPHEFTTGCERSQRRDAERKLWEHIGRKHQPSSPTPSVNGRAVDVSDALRLYGESVGLKAKSEANFRSALKVLVPEIGSVRIAALGEPEIRALHGRLLAKYKPGSARAWISILHRAVLWCESNKLIDGLAQPIRLWMPPQPKSIGRAITKRQAARLLWETKTMRYGDSAKNLALFIRIAIKTGARREAILALKWEPHADGGYIDLERGKIDFNRGSGEHTHKRRTRVPIPRSLQVALKAARRRTRTWVFEHGNGRRQTTIHQGWEVVRERAGLPTLRIHDLSHSAVSWMLDDGHSVKRVSAFTGKSMRTLLATYAHVLDGSLDAMADTL